jgi:hypothetical protein
MWHPKLNSKIVHLFIVTWKPIPNFKKLLTTDELPCVSLKQRNEHCWLNHVIPCGNQGLGTLT